MAERRVYDQAAMVRRITSLAAAALLVFAAAEAIVRTFPEIRPSSSEPPNGAEASDLPAVIATGTAGPTEETTSGPTPASPTWRIDALQDARALAVDGGLLAVAGAQSGLHLYSVPPQGAPVPGGTCELPGEPVSVTIDGTHAYVCGSTGLAIVDVSNPEAPTLVGWTSTPSAARAVALSGTTAYVATWDAGIVPIDVANPAEPVRGEPTNTPGHAYDVAITGDLLVLADFEGGVRTFTIDEGGLLVEAAKDESLRTATGVEISAGTVWVLDETTGVYAYPLPPARLEQEVALGLEGTTSFLALWGDTLAVSKGQGGAYCVKADPEDLRVLWYVADTGPTSGIAIDNHYVYYAAGHVTGVRVEQ